MYGASFLQEVVKLFLVHQSLTWCTRSSNHLLEQLPKFAKSINYQIGSFAQQLRSVKTCGETYGKALRISSGNDTIDRVFDGPAVFCWKFQPGNCFQEDFR